MNKALPKLESVRTILRLACLDDVPAIIRYYTENKIHLAPFEPLKFSGFYTESYWCEQVKEALDDFSADRSLRLFIFEKENESQSVIIGSINFRNFVRGVFQSCTLGYSLAEASQGKGYMTEALKLAIRYVFTELNMHRIMASYIPHNQRSGRLLKRLEFVVEGYARDYLMIDGQWQDHILTSLINGFARVPRFNEVTWGGIAANRRNGDLQSLLRYFLRFDVSLNSLDRCATSRRHIIRT